MDESSVQKATAEYETNKQARLDQFNAEAPPKMNSLVKMRRT